MWEADSDREICLILLQNDPNSDGIRVRGKKVNLRVKADKAVRSRLVVGQYWYLSFFY